MKKILIISGSMRKKGDGYSFLRDALDKKRKTDFDYEFLFLSDYEIKTCLGCGLCFKKKGSDCPRKDQVEEVVEKMKKADGIVFVSPVYERGISGHMKTFFDRTCYLIHKPLIYNKYFMSITTVDLGGGGSVNPWFRIIGESLGMIYTNSLSLLSIRYKNNNVYKDKMIKKLNKSFDSMELLINSGKVKTKFKNILRFHFWKNKTILFKDIYKGDFDYWNETGLLEKNYYTNIEVNFMEKLIIRIVKKIIPFILKKRASIKI